MLALKPVYKVAVNEGIASVAPLAHVRANAILEGKEPDASEFLRRGAFKVLIYEAMDKDRNGFVSFGV